MVFIGINKMSTTNIRLYVCHLCLKEFLPCKKIPETISYCGNLKIDFCCGHYVMSAMFCAILLKFFQIC